MKPMVYVAGTQSRGTSMTDEVMVEVEVVQFRRTVGALISARSKNDAKLTH